MTNFLSDAAPADLCLHAANFCYLASYLTRDMLWLRILTCVGMSLQIVFFTCGSVPMFGPTAWMAAFVGINLIQIARLLRYRERIQLNAEEAALSAEAFEHLTREELADLLTRSVRIGTRQTVEFNPHELTEGELTEDEIVLRDMAFGGLTRGDLLNLVTRRFHGTTAHLTPSRVRRWTERRKRRWNQWTAQRAAKKAGRSDPPVPPAAPARSDDEAGTLLPPE
ncbi:hypothetical protein [Alienimonas californiensis]|uniref:POPDC1-3 domain-containing protein n=1 Tax=Alienimonas californiensis TaxID=2527989 RepID=A0A517PAM1_9PLAN|nr:hypothetical protein [Alienimonas californiensis]QDT16424.1 hypothetical protein CA12_25260 [Alienimonas californiensis]